MGKHTGRIIYFAEIINTGVIKVGRTKDIPQRMCVLRKQAKSQIKILGTMDGDSKVELKIKLQFARYICQGYEWFWPHKSLLDYIQQNTKPYLGKVSDRKIKRRTSKIASFEQFIAQSNKERADLLEWIASKPVQLELPLAA